MSVSELERTQLAAQLTDVIGEEAAETLMKCILPEGREQLATKSDIEVLKGSVDALAREFRAEMGELRGQQDALAREFRAEHLESRSFVELKLARQARLHYGTLTAFLMSMKR